MSSRLRFVSRSPTTRMLVRGLMRSSYQPVRITSAFASPPRSWGDGGGRTAEHVIGDISYGPPYGVFVTCLNDGTQIEGTVEEIERGWNLHRGLHPDTVRLRQVRGVLATDGEVSDFLKHLDNPAHVAHYGGGSISAPDDGLEDAFDLLDRVRMLGERCSCATTKITECPNYTEGDDDN